MPTSKKPKSSKTKWKQQALPIAQEETMRTSESSNVSESEFDPSVSDPQEEEIKSPFEGTIGVMITKHSWGTQRKVRKNEAEAVASDGEKVSEKVTMSKRLLESDEYKAIASLDGAIDRDLEKLSIPSVLRKGVILIPFELFDQANKLLETYKKKRQELVSAFLDSYVPAIENARERLGPSLFNASQYPSLEVVQRKFWVDISTVNFDVSQNLKRLNQKLWQQERDKLVANMREATEEIRMCLRVQLQEMVDHLTDKLTGEKDNGKPKTFKAASIDNINEWLSLFSARNVTDDQALASLVQKCKDALSGVEPEKLRKDADVRTSTALAFVRVKQELDTMVVDRPTRKFSFEDDAQ